MENRRGNMYSLRNHSLRKPPPPPDLSKENLIIWDSWSTVGDRELTRESAAKGVHIKLAILFLAQRRSVSLEDAQNWFISEVLQWAKDLLTNKQVFKATHILNNISLDPIKEIIRIFTQTYEKELRSFLGCHLDKIKKLEQDLKSAWMLLECIERDQDILLCLQKEVSNKLNVEYVFNRNIDFKHEIAANLYFKNKDKNLEIFLTPEHTWKIFYKNNNIEAIKEWLKIQFSQISNTDSEYCKVFNQLNIDHELLDTILTTNNEAILNELCQFGIFNKIEQADVRKIIKRLSNNEILDNLKDILNHTSSNVDFSKFVSLLANYCVDNDLYAVLEICTKNDDFNFDISDETLNLIVSFRKLANNLNDKRILKENVILVNNYLKLDLNLLHYIFVNLLDDTTDLFEIFRSRDCDNDLSCDLFNNFSIVKHVYDKLSNNYDPHTLSVYDLLRLHSSLKVDEIFKYRFNADEELPNFNLNWQWSYNKKVNYLFYLKQYRPTKAIHFLSPHDTKVERKVHKLCIKNFADSQMTSSCISFLHLAEKDTKTLRMYIKLANIIDLDESTVKELFLKEKWNIILDLAEQAIMGNFDAKLYDILHKFAVMHNIKLPELYLKQLAKDNQWLKFLITIQRYNYPTEQSRHIATNFTSSTLAEHLNHCIQYDINYEEKSVLMKERDTRNFFLSRIGVRKHLDTSDFSSSSLGSINSISSSTTSSVGLSDLFDAWDNCDVKLDFLGVLIKAHNSTDPPKALLQACQIFKCPVLAVLATSYEPDSAITNWLTWLGVSCSMDSEIVSKLETLALSGNSVTEFLIDVVRRGYLKTLDASLNIFLNDHPLRRFVIIMMECAALNFDMEFIKIHFETFHRLLKFKRSNSVISGLDHEMIYLNNKCWIETTAINLLMTTLQHCFRSKYHKVRCLHLINELKIENYFFKELPNLRNIEQIYEKFLHVDVDINFCLILEDVSYKNQLSQCIEVLINQKLFDEALDIAKIGKLPTDQILLTKWSAVNFIDYEECNLDFKTHGICPEEASTYFWKAATDCANWKEKFLLLRLAHCWSLDYQLTNLAQIEAAMWLAWIKSDLLDLNTKSFVSNLSYSQMMKNFPDLKYQASLSLSTSEETRLNQIFARMLNCGAIFEALRLEKLFDKSCYDLKILKLCLNLAEGIIMPHQMTANERMLLNKANNVTSTYKSKRRTFLSTRLSGLSSMSQSPGSSYPQLSTTLDSEHSIQDSVSMMENLVDKLTTGIEYGQRVLMVYRISVNIDKSYQLIAQCENPMELLRKALQDDCRNKLEVVNDFAQVFKWTLNIAADFICEELILCTASGIKANLETLLMWDVNLDTQFHMILQLLPDNCTLLGNKLYAYTSACHKAICSSNGPIVADEVRSVIELLIRSHDAFTADCNMEGISIVLNKCHSIVATLLGVKAWPMIVRLLTGVARYTEMNYIFHILRENDQFEYLLGKGKVARLKDNALKTAVLEYLKKYCPDNKELYRMVALHFVLFSEVAQLWERESENIISNLIAIAKLEMQNRKMNPDTCLFIEFTNSDGTKLCLNKAMVNYNHATEYHLQGGKFAKAMNAAKQAELLALQLSTLKGLPSNGTTFCLLHLDSTQVLNLIAKHLSFAQGLILSESYNYQIDWATAIFEQFVVSNKRQYLDCFQKCLSLTDSLVNDISRRFLQSNVLINALSIANMKEIVQKLSSVHTKYRIASELGFSDVLEELLNGNRLVYLKDTVWKKGYKN